MIWERSISVDVSRTLARRTRGWYVEEYVRADRSSAHVIQGSYGPRTLDSPAVPQDETDYCFATFMYPPRYICPPAPR